MEAAPSDVWENIAVFYIKKLLVSLVEYGYHNLSPHKFGKACKSQQWLKHNEHWRKRKKNGLLGMNTLM